MCFAYEGRGTEVRSHQWETADKLWVADVDFDFVLV